jgi:hypothetical protein
MAVDERRRHEMYLAFEELVGAEVAATMMEHLPPVGWADVATRHDLEREVAVLRAEMHAGFAELRTEMHDGFGELRTEIARSSQRVLMWMMGVLIPGFCAVAAAIIAT